MGLIMPNQLVSNNSSKACGDWQIASGAAPVPGQIENVTNSSLRGPSALAKCNITTPSLHAVEDAVVHKTIDFGPLREEVDLAKTMLKQYPDFRGIKELVSYDKNIKSWDGRPLEDYMHHLETECRHAWLNSVPETINPANLGLHGTNLDVVLRALSMGGQLLPTGNCAKRGGDLVTGESGVTGLNMRRVSTVGIAHGFLVEPALRWAKRYATNSSTVFLKQCNGTISRTPVVVIGDGLDKIARLPHSDEKTEDNLMGVRVRSDIGGEIAFKRLNIRGLLCNQADREFIQTELDKFCDRELPITTFQEADAFLQRHETNRYDKKSFDARMELLEMLTGQNLMDRN